MLCSTVDAWHAKDNPSALQIRFSGGPLHFGHEIDIPLPSRGTLNTLDVQAVGRDAAGEALLLRTRWCLTSGALVVPGVSMYAANSKMKEIFHRADCC